MWFLPSRGRPEKIAAMRDAPGGMPDDLIIIVGDDDPKLAGYRALPLGPWRLDVVPGARTLADKARWIDQQYPSEACYGFLADDYWPITPEWWKALEAAAEDRFIAIANDQWQFPRFRTCSCFGGGLLRAAGKLIPDGFIHCFTDDVWEQTAAIFGLIKPLADVIVLHRHHINSAGAVVYDATYREADLNFARDKATFERWMQSDDRIAMTQRIAKFLGVEMTAMDMKGKRLAICMLLGDFNMDVMTYQSLSGSLAELANMGIVVRVFHTAGGSNVGKARERVLWSCMQSGFNPDFIWFVDNDMAWAPRLPLHLMAADHEFSGVVGVKKGEPVSFCANFTPGEQKFHPRTHFLEVVEVGFGCVMLKASVIEQLVKGFPDLMYHRDDGAPEHALFLEMIDIEPDGRRMRLSEDLSFCRRWRKLGGKIYVDHQQALGHFGRKEYTGRVSDMFEIGNQQPQSEAAE